MSNRLANETSPYLLQHKDNPVEWYPWCDEAFERAAREDKPVFLSIGYSACFGSTMPQVQVLFATRRTDTTSLTQCSTPTISSVHNGFELWTLTFLYQNL